MSPSIIPKSSFAALNDVLADSAEPAKFSAHLSNDTVAATVARFPISLTKELIEVEPAVEKLFNSVAALFASD